MFPTPCPITKESVNDVGHLSPAGWARLQFLAEPACSACGWPFSSEDSALPLCSVCAAPRMLPNKLVAPSRLDRVRSAVAYDDISSPLILALKYGDHHHLAPVLGRLLLRPIAALDAPADAALLPVPLHNQRLKARRFNQSAVIASSLARLTGMPTARRVLKRIKATPPQQGLTRAERRRNLSGAFAASQAAAGGAFILVDDVLTSGATLIACARALRQKGARWVGAVTVARVLPTAQINAAHGGSEGEGPDYG